VKQNSTSSTSPNLGLSCHSNVITLSLVSVPAKPAVQIEQGLLRSSHSVGSTTEKTVKTCSVLAPGHNAGRSRASTRMHNEEARASPETGSLPPSLRVNHSISSVTRLAAIFPLFPRRLQFPIPVGQNLLPMPVEHVLRRDVADGAA
jgi:hypothetical protein